MKVTQPDGSVKEIDIFFDKKATRGRPRKILTEDALKVIEKMASIMCTEEEIALCIGASVDTLLNDDNKDLFRTAIKKGQSSGKQSLRREQWNVAKRGNATMLIWLGKQWLNQTDKVEQVNSFEDLTPLAELLKIEEE